jgi:xanthine dehydrogenase accessory factor
MRNVLLLRGGGDLASGVAIRLYRAGIPILITEIETPLAVRRTVSFSEAVFENMIEIEGVMGVLVSGPEQAELVINSGRIPVLIDPNLEKVTTWSSFQWSALVDGRLLKIPPPSVPDLTPFTVGLGPGFMPGRNCVAAVETLRGHTLGRVYWNRAPEDDTGIPEGDPIRVLRAPEDGVIHVHARIGDQVLARQMIAHIQVKLSGGSDTIPNRLRVEAPFAGVLRGLIRPGLAVERDMKVGDVDPRNDPSYCWLVSDKALAVGGGVLEALLSRPEVRRTLWTF